MFLLLVFYDMTTDSASLRRDTNDKKSLHLTDNSLEKRTLNSILGAILSVVVVLACVQSSVRARVQERQMTPPPSGGSKHYQSRNSSINRVRMFPMFFQWLQLHTKHCQQITESASRTNIHDDKNLFKIHKCSCSKFNRAIFGQQIVLETTKFVQ